MSVRCAVPAVMVLMVTATAAGAADPTPMVTKAPAVPPPPALSGYLELYTGWSRAGTDFQNCLECTPFSGTNNGWVLGGAGRINYWWAPNASVQFDVQGDGTSYKADFGQGATAHAAAHNYLIGAHASWRNQAGLFGVFGGAGDASDNPITFASVRHGIAGIEGQLYLNALTLFGQVGYDSTMGGDIFPGLNSINAWFLRGTARYYINHNLRLEGTALYADGRGDAAPLFSGDLSSAKFKTWLWRAKAEYKFDTAPFSLFAAYQGSRTKTNESFGDDAFNSRVTDHRVTAGLRIYFGDATLQANDRSGATLDIIDPLGVPSFTVPPSLTLGPT